LTPPPDVLVIGGGPAGVGAALAAAGHGLAVTLVDEAPQAGGQVYRATPRTFRNTPTTSDHRIGETLRYRLAESVVETIFDHAVWSVSPGFRVDALGPRGLHCWHSRAVIVATGAQERVVPFPGWTLPGVIGLAGATILLKSQHMLPGRRTLVAGCGPLLLAVAAGILKAGGEVAGVIDLASRREWLSTLSHAISRPDLLARGTAWAGRLKAAGVPILSRHSILRVEPGSKGLHAVVGPLDPHGRPVCEGKQRLFDVDAVAVGNGLTPSTDITRLLQADHVFNAAQGGWHARIDSDFRTSVAGLYAVGDATGISGAAAAELDGQLAGLAAAHDLGALPAPAYESQVPPLRSRAARARRFGGAMARLMALKPGQVAAVPAGTILCRCEDVTRAEIDAAIGEGAVTVNQLKAWTRAGMGPCQGRICGDIIGTLLAGSTEGCETAQQFTGRSPA
jgi:thioredoxin reductase